MMFFKRMIPVLTVTKIPKNLPVSSNIFKQINWSTAKGKEFEQVASKSVKVIVKEMDNPSIYDIQPPSIM